MPVVRLVPDSTPVLDAVRDLLPDWELASDGPVDALVVDPGLLDGAPVLDAADLIELVRTTDFGGGGAVAVIGSRDQLGWADRPELAAAAGALFATVRSLALAHAPQGITINLVAGSTAADPAPLLPGPAGVDDLAAAIAFLVHPRSRYVTGQLLFCAAGADLPSSLSI